MALRYSSIDLTDGQVAGGEMDALLSWATGLVERRKLRFLLSTQSIERAGNYMLLKGYRESLEPLVSQVAAQTAEGSSELTVTLDNPRIFSQVAWNDTSNGYSYSYIDDQGFERTVFIENAGSLTSKLNLLASYNIRDVSIRVPESGDVDENIWDILLQFQQGADLVAEMGQHSVSYTVYDSSGNVIGQDIRPLEAPAARFQQVSNDGAVRVEAQILGANGQPVTANYATETEVASSLSAAAKEDIATAAAETDVARAESEAEGIVAAASNDGTPRVTTSQVLNVREGPSTAHTILGQTGTGDNYSVVAKNEAGDWWQVEYNGGIGWVFGQLVSASGAVDAVAVTTDFPEPPAIVEAPAAGGGAAAPVVAAPAPSGAVPFGYGVQAHMVDNGQAGQVMSVTQGMGFNWVKQQIEWKRFEADQGNIAWGGMDEMINAANNAGISLLFSVVNAPAWARESGFDGSVGGPPADPQTFANFNGAIAGKYCGSSLKMMEIWNEQNLHYEWGNKPLNAGEYVALLAPSYAAVKAACPQMVVVSGALTPAGNNPGFAVDDFTYLEEMFKAGAANYFDALGAHPSGYNVPPDSTWEQACEAIVANGNSFNGACDSPHHSWSFRSTMEGYRNIMSVYGAGDRVIVPSEFGWAAGGALDPRYKYADDNDYQEQAQWTVRAYQMMREWGWVGPAFLWNLNFRVVANGTEKAQWGIVDPGWGPLPVYNALASMPK